MAAVVGVLLVLTSGQAAADLSPPPTATPFTHVVVDADNPNNPHNKAMGDIDGDGQVDLLAGSSNGGGLHWYRYPSWSKHRIADGSFTTDMQVADIDGDGDLDAVIPDGSGIRWYRNPRPATAPHTTLWQGFPIGAHGANNHDVEVGDVDRDGKIDVVTRQKTGGGTYLWLQDTPTSWTRIVVTTRSGEGTALGDIDRDGDLDIAQNGFWVETPPDPRAGPWREHTIAGNWPADVGVLIEDLDEDGRPDIVLGPSESPGRLSWYEAADPRAGPWVEHPIDAAVQYLHTFKAADIDLDGDPDLVTAEMHQAADPDTVGVYVNGGDATSWTQQTVSGTGSHNLRTGDVDADGDIDIYGANWNDGAPNSAVVELWRNELNPRLPLDRWRRHVVDSTKPWRSIFVTSADLDGDRRTDVVTGGWWYRNPGRLDDTWSRRAIAAPLHNMAAVFDADRDGDVDVLGTKGQGSDRNSSFTWATNNGAGSFDLVDNVDSTANADFLQGVAAGRFTPTGPLEVALSWHEGGHGIHMLEVPDSPSLGRWPSRQLSPVSQDEDLSSGDIDRDGDDDLLLGTKWLRNDGSAWTPLTLFQTSEEPDRARLADVNGDGRLDAVVGYEVSSPSGKLAWYAQGPSAEQAWAEHVIAHVVGPLSVASVDLDGDGDADVIAGEHNLASPSSSGLYVYENADGEGTSWRRHLVHIGDEHHDGAHVSDVDGDGDLDIVSIGWSHGNVLVYENLARSSAPAGDTSPPTLDAVRANGDRQRVEVVFSEPVEASSAEVAANYSVNHGVEVLSASLGPDGKTVTLTTSAVAGGVDYTLGVENVRDRAGNVVAAGTRVRFRYTELPMDGLELWLRSDADLTLEGGRASRWADQSGQGTHAAQMSARSRPSVVEAALNGRPVLRFDGVDDFMTFELPLNGFSGLTLVLVSAARADRDGSWNGVESAPLFWNETSSWGTVHLSPSQSNVRWRFGTGQGSNLPRYARPVTIGSAYTMTIARKQGASEQLYVDGQLALAQGGKSATLAAIRPTGNLGRGYNDNTYFSGDLAEVLVYTRALTDTERASVEDYLRQKYFP